MSVIAFPNPFVHRAHRRCRKCSANIEVILLNGASCARDPYYTCCDCSDAPVMTGARLALVCAEPQPELEL